MFPSRRLFLRRRRAKVYNQSGWGGICPPGSALGYGTTPSAGSTLRLGAFIYLNALPVLF